MNVSAITATINSAAIAVTRSAPSVAAVAPTAPVSTSTSSNNSGSGTVSAPPLYSATVQIFDAATGQVVVETLNTSTGVVQSQTPDKAALQYERAQMLAARNTATRGAKLAAAA